MNLTVPFIFVGPYGTISSLAAIVFVACQTLWLVRSVRAVRRIRGT